MTVNIKRFDKTLPLPEYQTQNCAGFDLLARENALIEPHKIKMVPLNIAVEKPLGHFLLLAARSSLHKKGLMLANGVGIGDPDFCGNDDQYAAALLNFTDSPVIIARGDRLVQGVFVKFDQARFNEVDVMVHTTRGGYGSTGER